MWVSPHSVREEVGVGEGVVGGGVLLADADDLEAGAEGRGLVDGADVAVAEPDERDGQGRRRIGAGGHPHPSLSWKAAGAGAAGRVPGAQRGGGDGPGEVIEAASGRCAQYGRHLCEDVAQPAGLSVGYRGYARLSPSVVGAGAPGSEALGSVVHSTGLIFGADLNSNRDREGCSIRRGE